MPRFVSGDSYAGNFGYEWDRHRRTQVDSVSGLHRSRDAFLEKTGLTPGELAGARVLDVGVGSGRFAEIAADLGAIVTGIDLTRAVDSAAQNLGDRATIAQADLFRPPFADGSFDVVYSLGVLHHTPDTHAAFERVARLVRPGGILAVWIYHPLKTDAVTGLYRRATTRMSSPALYRLATVAAPIWHLYHVPLAGSVARRLLPISWEPDREWRILDTFDWYSPRYQWKHTIPEVRGWFEALGYEDIRVLAFPTSVRGRRPVAGTLDARFGNGATGAAKGR